MLTWLPNVRTHLTHLKAYLLTYDLLTNLSVAISRSAEDILSGFFLVMIAMSPRLIFWSHLVIGLGFGVWGSGSGQGSGSAQGSGSG